MRTFTIVAILIAFLVTIYLINRGITSRMSENENQSKKQRRQRERSTTWSISFSKYSKFFMN